MILKRIVCWFRGHVRPDTEVFGRGIVLMYGNRYYRCKRCGKLLPCDIYAKKPRPRPRNEVDPT